MPKKAPDAFRTISEVSEWLGVSPHVLRFWESKFTQVKPVKRAGGRRYYRPADMELLGGIRKLLHDDGLTVKGVQKVLKEQGVRTVSSMSPPVEIEEGAAAPANPIFRAPKPNVDLPVSETTGQKDAASLPLFADKFADARLPAHSPGAPTPDEAPPTESPAAEAPPDESTAAESTADEAPSMAAEEAVASPAAIPEPEPPEISQPPEAPDQETPVAADPATAPEPQDLPETASPVDGAMISDPGIPEPSAAPHLSPPDPTVTQEGPVIAPLPDLAGETPQDAPGPAADPVAPPEPQAPAPVQGRPLLIAPLPTTTLPLSERLWHLVPGQIPVDKLKPLHAKLTALRARMNDG